MPGAGVVHYINRVVDQVKDDFLQLNPVAHDGRPFLLGDRATLADVLAYPPLARFDAVYNPLFRASRRRLVDYTHLPALVKRIHNMPGVAETTRYDHILTHYYDGDWAVATRRGIRSNGLMTISDPVVRPAAKSRPKMRARDRAKLLLRPGCAGTA